MIINKKKQYTDARIMTPAEMNRLHFDSKHSKVERRDRQSSSSGVDPMPKK